jgi:hypothetical protein
MSKNRKAEERREAQFYARQDRCAACGRILISRKLGWACCRACREKLGGQPNGKQ